MIKKITLFVLVIVLVNTMVMAQDSENENVDITQIKAEIAKKEAVMAEAQARVDALAGEVAGLKRKIELNSGWKFGANGILGFKIAGFQNWAKQGNPNSKVSDLTGIFKGRANLDKEKYFWRNEGNINLGWQQLILDTEKDDITDEEKEYKNVADVMTITSLFGYKVTKDIAVSVLGQYSSSIIENFNNKGILDIGVGATWKPSKIPNLVVTVHPLNYHIVFQEELGIETESALGTKIFASYFTKLVKGVNWSTDLNGFLEYGKSTPSLNE